ncbi:hypothetical protein ACFV2N_33365 [Streptomyces sp. NPDC059680]|uniref:hypothetical protein n=1 Tax=Streptomyces sp. NPDC059680 TaxID=3346904 RepID=UPI003677BE83
MADRTAWRIRRDNGWWRVFGEKHSSKKAGPPVHDDLVRRIFTADGPTRLWLAEITELAAGEGKLYPFAVKEVFSKRIVGQRHRRADESRPRRRSLGQHCRPARARCRMRSPSRSRMAVAVTEVRPGTRPSSVRRIHREGQGAVMIAPAA